MRGEFRSAGEIVCLRSQVAARLIESKIIQRILSGNYEMNKLVFNIADKPCFVGQSIWNNATIRFGLISIIYNKYKFMKCVFH